MPTTITAAMVKELRALTDAAMMDCKKALENSAGDMQAAVDFLRKSGQAKAAKRAGKIVAEGAIVIAMNPEKMTAAMLEVNFENDFVARDQSFKSFSDMLAKTSLKINSVALTEIMSHKSLSQPELTCEQVRESLVLKIGENIQPRRVAIVTSVSGCVGAYLHGDRIGVLVAIDQKNDALAKDIAMHIAATNPVAIDEKDIPEAFIAKEREIFTAQAQSSGKAEAIIAKMVEGRLQKYMKEVCIVHQSFVKNPDQTVGDLLKAAHAKLIAFARFEVGEGIEKQVTDFAEEVNATLKGSA